MVDQKYLLEERLGEDAFGVVYRAVHVGLEKAFAIKLLNTAGPPAPAAIERFRRDIAALRDVRHPHIVEVADFGIDGLAGNRPYVVTEVLEGKLLSEFCREQGPWPLAQALPLLEQIAAALDAAHGVGILHRDLNSGNVLVSSESQELPSVKVLNFGLAGLLAGADKYTSSTFPSGEESLPGLITTGSLLGTPQYLAPEVIRFGQASRSSDIYSFGILAYEVLSGVLPFQGTLEEVLAGHLEADPPPLPLSPEVWRPLRETLQKDAACRPAAAGIVVSRFQSGKADTTQRCWRSIEAPGFLLGKRESTAGNTQTILTVTGFEQQLGKRDQFAAEYDQVHADISRAGQDLDSRNALQERLCDLESRIEDFVSPVLSPLGWKATRAFLARGTAFLAYRVGEAHSLLFVIENGWVPGVGFFLYPLAIGREELKREVEAFRNAWGPPGTDLSALKERGQHLYDLLIRPAEPVLGKADRWLISPDGPLHSLAFAALSSGTHYLGDFKSIYFETISAGERRVYLRKPREQSEERRPRGITQAWIEDLFHPYCAQLTGTWSRSPQPAWVPGSQRTSKTIPKCTPSLPITTERLVDGKYRLQKYLGEGAIGLVYRAVHVGLEKAVAIKLLKTAGPPAPAALERFRREAVALGRLRHPHIVVATDSGADGAEGGFPYLVTELLEGMPLSDVCRDQGLLPLWEALDVLSQIAAAIDAAHDAGILHRDLKPVNVFVCSEREDRLTVKVLDFGLAELLAGPDRSTSGTFPGGVESPPGLTATGSLLGTPLYLAPELIRHSKASRSSDIYSFGVIAYEILGGRPPFRGTVEEVLACHLEEDPPPLPLPPELWRPLRDTLQKDPALRPGTAGEVVLRFLKGIDESGHACHTSCCRDIWHYENLDSVNSLHEKMGEVLSRFFDLPWEFYTEYLRLATSYHQAQVASAKLRRPDGGLRELALRIEALLNPFLGVTQNRDLLTPETALLTYYLGESQSFLFVTEAKEVPGVGLFLYPLAIGKEELSRKVKAFRNVWSRPETDLSSLKELGRDLYDLLIRPAEPVLAKADRWLISPDEPLQALPFATLFSGIRYLADLKPVYIDHTWLTHLRP